MTDTPDTPMEVRVSGWVLAVGLVLAMVIMLAITVAVIAGMVWLVKGAVG